MRLNVRFALIFSLVLLVLGGVIWGAHRLQVNQSAGRLLAEARQAVEEQRIGDAARLYRRYLAIDDQSAEAHAELGDLLADANDPRAAFFQLETALRLQPDALETRRQLVDVAMRLARYRDAKLHLEQHLIPQQPGEARLYWLLGQCEAGLGNHAAAVEHFAQAVKLAPKEPEYAASLAGLLSDELNQADRARSVLDALVAANPQDADSFVARGQWLLSRGRQLSAEQREHAATLFDAAWQDASAAITLQPTEAATAIFAAEAGVAADELDQAEQVVAAAIEANPSEPRLYGSASQIELSRGNVQQAVEHLRRGIAAIPGDRDLLWNLAQLQAGEGKIEDVETLLTELRARDYPAGPIQYLEAQVLASRGQWRSAAQLLEKTRPLLDRSEELLKHADFLLAVCYGNMGNNDQQLVALRRAVGQDPLWLPGRVSLADALLDAGRIREAMGEYWQIVRQPDAPVEAMLSLARAIFIDNLGQGSEQADWGQFDQVLKILADRPDAAAEVAVLKAEKLVALKKPLEAEQLLQDFLQQHRDESAAWLALIALHNRSEDWDAVESTLKQAKQHLEDSPQLRIVEGRYLARRHGGEVDEAALTRLAQPLESWDDVQRTRLASGFATLFLSLKEYELSEQYAWKAAETEVGKNNLAIQLLLFDLAFRGSDLEMMSAVLEHVKAIEGSGPLWQVGEAIRLAALASGDQLSEQQRGAYYEQSLRHLAEAEVERPGWSKIPRFRGKIHDSRDETALALQNYLEAIEAGDRDPQLISRTIVLLYSQNRFVEANEVVRTLQQQKLPFSGELTRVASEVSLQLENFDQALSLAKNWAEQSEKQEDQVWLAQVYSITGAREEAIKQFRRAIEMDPTTAGPWVSLIQLQARGGDVQAARETIAEAKAAIDPAEVDDAIAQGYESIKDYDQARQHYKRALARHPDDAGIIRRVADFYLKLNEKQRAIPLLEQLVAGDLDVGVVDQSWARRNLALVLGLDGGDLPFERARSLIAANIDQLGENAEDQRTLAIILASRDDSESAQRAVEILEGVVKNQRQFSLEDNFLLAQLYAKVDNWTAYSRTMRGVLGNGGAENSRYVAAYAEALVNHKELGEAALWFNRLKQLAPQERSTDLIEAKLLFQSADYDRLADLLDDETQSPERLLWSAELAEAFGSSLQRRGESVPAERLLQLARRKIEQYADSVPEGQFALAAFHAKQGEIEAALRLHEQNDFAPDQLAELGQVAIQSSEAEKSQLAALADVLEKAFAAHPAAISVGICTGDLHSHLGDWQQAAQAYNAVLRKQPNHWPALNNLAMISALTSNELDQAARAIERAIRLAGPRDFLIDTRGSVRLAQGKAADAESDFRVAIASSPRPDRYFHLALALQAQGKTDEARTAFAVARDAGLTTDLVHPLEQAAFEQLAERT